MDDLIKLALANSFKKATDNFKPVPGVHNIDATFTLHVKGTVTKSADGLSKPTVNIPLKTTLALILEKSGFMREHSKALLIEAMQEALALEAKGEEFVAERVKNIEEAMSHVEEIIGELPKVPKSGRTTIKVTVEETVQKAA